jgi:hypothetical protein
MKRISKFSRDGYSKIEKVLLEDSGLSEADTLHLYEREDVKNQVVFLEEEVMHGENVG